MTAREIGELFKRSRGKDIGKYMPRARLAVGQVKEALRLGKLEYGHHIFNYTDGLSIRVIVYSGSHPGKTIDIVEIYPPPDQGEVETQFCESYLESGVLDLKSSFLFGVLDAFDLDSYRPAELDTGGLDCEDMEPYEPQGILGFTWEEDNPGTFTPYLRCRDNDDTESVAIGCPVGERTESVNTPTVPPQVLETDAGEPDLCEDLYDLKMWANHVPASFFTGKMRGYIQALHGSDRRDWRAEETLLLGVWDFYAAERRIQYLYNVWSEQDLLITGPDYHYWLLTMKPSSVKLQPMQPSGCGERIRLYMLDAIERGLYSDRESRTPIESFLLSTLSPQGEQIDITDLTDGLADDLSDLVDHGLPFGPYGWHANWDGSEAAIIVNRPHPDYLGSSTNYRHQASRWSMAVTMPARGVQFDADDASTWFIGPDDSPSTDALGTIVALTLEEELVEWQPRFANDFIWYAYPQADTIRMLPFVPLLQFYNPTPINSTPPIYCFYDYKTEADGGEASDELIIIRYQYELIGANVETINEGATSAGTTATCGCNDRLHINANWTTSGTSESGFYSDPTDQDYIGRAGNVSITLYQFVVKASGLEVPTNECGGWLRLKRTVNFHDEIYQNCLLIGPYSRPNCPSESNAWTRSEERCTFELFRIGLSQSVVTFRSSLLIPWLNCDAVFPSAYYTSSTPALGVNVCNDWTQNYSWEAGPRFGQTKPNCPETSNPDCYDCVQWEDCPGYVLQAGTPSSCRPPFPIPLDTSPGCTEADTVGPSALGFSINDLLIAHPPSRGGLYEQDAVYCEHRINIQYRRIDGGVLNKNGYTPYFPLRQSESHTWAATYPRCREVHLDSAISTPYLGSLSPLLDIMPTQLPQKYRGLYPEPSASITNEASFSWGSWFDFFNQQFFTQPYSLFVIEGHDSLRDAHRFIIPDGPAEDPGPYDSLSQTKTTFVGYG